MKFLNSPQACHLDAALGFYLHAKADQLKVQATNGVQKAIDALAALRAFYAIAFPPEYSGEDSAP